MLKTETLFELADITICPTVISDIESRSECIPVTSDLEQSWNDFYPLIASPMSTVVSLDNYEKFRDNKISCIIPRNIPIETRLEMTKDIFCAFSLSEIQEHFIDLDYQGENLNVLIDVANGHMKKQIDLGRAMKVKYGKNLLLMGGNIANPETALLYADAGFDYLRVGIAGGSRCLTGTQTGVYCPMASLISETAEILGPESSLKIIADGGIGSYSDIIKCLALGADYVMLGKLFAQSFEGGTGTIYDVSLQYVSGEKKFTEAYWRTDAELERDYYGMSTKKAQAEIGGSGAKLKTSEGKIGRVRIKYDLPGWINNLDSYLRSSMSYCGARNLDEYKSKAHCQVISPIASGAINGK